jgi:hypothetical protein
MGPKRRHKEVAASSSTTRKKDVRSQTRTENTIQDEVMYTWATQSLQTGANLMSAVALDHSPELELEFRKPVKTPTEWNVYIGRQGALYGPAATTITGSGFVVEPSIRLTGCEYLCGGHRIRHWDDTPWTGVRQKKMPHGTLSVSSGTVHFSLESNVQSQKTYTEHECKKLMTCFNLVRTTNVIKTYVGWQAPEIHISMTQRNLTDVWIANTSKQDIEVELVVPGRLCTLDDATNASNIQNWCAYVQCLNRVWLWFRHGIIGNSGMAASGITFNSSQVPQIPKEEEEGEQEEEEEKERGKTVSVMLPSNVLPVEGKDTHALIVGTPFTVSYDGKNFDGRGGVWFREGSQQTIRLSEFLVDDNRDQSCMVIPSALVSNKRLRYATKSGLESAFAVYGVMISGVYVVTRVVPSSALSRVKRSWPRTFAVHFMASISTSNCHILASGRWIHQRVQWDVVQKVHTDMTHTLTVTTLVPIMIKGSTSTGKTGLFGTNTVVLVDICAHIQPAEESTTRIMLRLSARNEHNEKVVVLVDIADFSNVSVMLIEEFDQINSQEDVISGSAWALFDRHTRTVRLEAGLGQPYCTLFPHMQTYSQFLWMQCDLGGREMRSVDAFVDTKYGCYVRPSSTSKRIVWIASPPRPPSSAMNDDDRDDVPQMVQPEGLYTLHLVSMAYMSTPSISRRDRTDQRKGYLKCISWRDTEDTSQMRPVSLL